MNLRGIVNGVTSGVNPNERVTVFKSIGYTIGVGAKQIPNYDVPISMLAQIQALDGKDLQQLEGLNIQGAIRSIYIRGSLSGTNRPNQTGGDIIKRKNDTETWLVVKVLETWDNWTKAAIVQQVDA